MSAIYGVVRMDGGPVDSAAVTSLQRELGLEGSDEFACWAGGNAAFGQRCTGDFRASGLEYFALADPDAGFVFVGAGRVDDREELARELGAASDRHTMADAHLLLAAYKRWRDDAPSRLLGDWSFAAWHPREHRLFIARDRLGPTPLYYHSEASAFAFAPSQRALLALGVVKPELNELYLAQYLVSWPAYHGEHTGIEAIKSLRPGHSLTVTPKRLEVRRYWEIEAVAEPRLRSRDEYVRGLREHLDEAVRARLRSPSRVGVTLSGGLDSSSIAVTAAAQLRREAKHLLAFTAHPQVDARRYVSERFGDELPLAQRTAAFAGNVELVAVDGSRLSPVGAIRHVLAVLGYPVHGAANLFWIVDMLQTAHDCGCSVLLNGQLGNAVISWAGGASSQPLAYQARTVGPVGLTRLLLRRVLPDSLRIMHARMKLDPQWYRTTAIHPALAQRLHLAARRLGDPAEYPGSPLQARIGLLHPLRSGLGSASAALGAHHGIEVRDPTSDVRLVSFALSVPDRVFIDPETRTDRWLIREAMRGRLPDEVRLNRRRGRQAADLVPRLRASAEEVDAALDELDRGPAADYVDVSYMREVFALIQREDTPEALHKAGPVLMRGIMGGLYVNSLEGPAAAPPSDSRAPARTSRASPEPSRPT